MTVDSSDSSAPRATVPPTSTPVDLIAVEDRIRRDSARTSAAISILSIAVVIAAVFALGWRMNLLAPASKSKDPRPPNGPVVPVGDPGKFGLALDLGEHPDAPAEVPAAAARPEDQVLADLAAILEAAGDRPLNDVKRPVKNPGVPGGPIGPNKNVKGPGPDRAGRPSSERWSIEWGADTEAGYRRKLDHFGIYIGAVRAGQLVAAVRKFDAARPQTSMNPPSLWFIHRDRSRVELDRKLLSGAGVAVLPIDIVAQFFPPQLQATLTSLEEQFSHKNTNEIKRTVFGVRPAGAGYEFYVVEQQLK